MDEETDFSFSGTGQNPSTPPINWDMTETKSGLAITMLMDYEDPSPHEISVTGTINTADESMSGTWVNLYNNNGGTWASTSGAATLSMIGSGWGGAGYFNLAELPPFTFTTDELGSASWHLNLRNAHFYGPGTYDLSIWINEAIPNKTMLVSYSFEVVVD